MFKILYKISDLLFMTNACCQCDWSKTKKEYFKNVQK